MKRIWGLLKAVFLGRTALYIVGMVIVAALIWFIGPLIGIGDVQPLSGVVQRTIAITLIPALMGAGAGFSNVRLGRENAELQASLTSTPEAQASAKASAAGAEEVAGLGGRLKEALDLLKKSKMRRTWGSGWLYQLPWYMLIGPPGAGKTTALVNSGLNFPLAAELGNGAVRGIGGTRSCDWWFTDDAVLIDTAGRYTTQDSETAADAAAWTGFLKLLKKYRKRQPINGALVAIGLSDLLESNEAKQVEHARAIRARLRELDKELGVRFPVYVLFTKADRIAGFVEYFDDLGREGREQVWGATFPLTKGEDPGGIIAAYPAEFDGLVGRLNDRLVERLQQETDIQRRSLIFGFPQQIAALKEITHRFLKEIFEPNRYEQPARLRGIYLTSGTQDGTPIDRLMSAVAGSFGISRQQVAAFSGTGRTYFLTRLMRDVIFGEAGLVSADSKLERRARMIRYGVIGGMAALILIMTVGWVLAFFTNSSMIADIKGQSTAYNDKAKGLQLERVSDRDLRPILPLLAILRDLPGGYAHRHDGASLVSEFGLYQGEKLGSQAIAVYRRDLGRLLLPRMMVRLEEQLAQNQAHADFLYEALKVYLMLGQQQPGKIDKALISRWMALDWAIQLPGPENEETRRALGEHLDALLEKPLPQIALNGPLVEQSRAILLRVPLAERAYSLLKTHPKITALPEWRISDHAGPAVARVLIRPSGRSLAEGIPGLYTYAGYYGAFKPLLPDVAKEIAKDSWVLGPQTKVADDPASIGRLQRDVTSLYLEDFAAQWDRLLADISVVPVTGVSQATQILNILSAPDSPLRALLVSAANETWLSKPPEKAPETPATPNALAAVAQQAAQQAAAAAAQQRTSRLPDQGKGLADQQLSSLLGTQAGGNDDIAGPFTDKRFKALHDFAGGTGQGPPAIDAVMGDLNDLYMATNRAAASGDASKVLAGGGDNGAAAKLAADASRAPGPVQAMVGSLTHGISAMTAGDARAQLNAQWAASVLPFCQSAMQGRYPAFRSATQEMTPDDFAKLFAKGGLIDGFFTANLQQFVDMSKNPWTWQKNDRAELGIPVEVLGQFQRAAAIRDNMFGAGAGKLGISFEILPVSLDNKSTQVLLDVDGQTITYDHGPQRPMKMSWPGPGGVGHVRLAFQPGEPGEDVTVEKDGVWAWFRMLQDAHLKSRGGADRYLATFTVGNRTASFEIRANSVVNPFASNEIEAFRCPPKL